MQQIADATGNDGLKETAEEVGALAQNFQAAGQGFASSGSWIGAVVGGVTDIIGQTVNAFTEGAAMTKVMEMNAENFANALRLASLTVDRSDFAGIFGTDRMGLAQEYGRKMVESMEAYSAELEKVNDEYDCFSKKSFKTMEQFLLYQSSAEKGLEGLQRMLVKTKDFSGWANLWGRKDEYMTLGELVPELWENGELNLEVLDFYGPRSVFLEIFDDRTEIFDYIGC